MAQKLSPKAVTPDDLFDITLRELLKNSPGEFHSYVDCRLWGVGSGNSRRISAEKLVQIIDKFKLSGVIRSDLENEIREGAKSIPDYYLFDYKNFNYFIHLFDANNDLMLVAKKPITVEDYCFRDILDSSYKVGGSNKPGGEWKPLNTGWFRGLPRHQLNAMKRKREETEKEDNEKIETPALNPETMDMTTSPEEAKN